MFCSCWVKCDTCINLSVGKSAEFLCTDLFESYSSSLNCEIVTTMAVKHRQWTGCLTPYTSKSRTISFEEKNSTCGMGRGECPNFFNRTHTGWSIFSWQHYRRTKIFHAKVAFPWPGVSRLKSPPLDFTNVSYLKDKTKIKKTMISKWIHPFFHNSLPKW